MKASRELDSEFTVIWVDTNHARLIQLSDEQMSRETLEHPPGQTSAPNTLFDQVLERLQNTRRILIMGPGTAKHRLLSRLNEKTPELARRVVGCEPSDYPTDRQIAAYASKYFKKTAI